MDLRSAASLKAVFTACLLLLAVLGCSKEKRRPSDLDTLVDRISPSDVKVLLVGIDGGTFRVIQPMVAEGRLPTLRKLMEEGAYGVLESVDPMRSPALWTTIATGRDQEAHGIEGFASTRNPVNDFFDKIGIHKEIPLNKYLDKLGVRKQVLVGSNDRKVTALWNQVGPFGKTVGFCGWWATWPAEPVSGWIISDRVTRSSDVEWEGRERRTEYLTYWPELIDELRPLTIDPATPPMDEINSLVELTDEELSEFHAVKKPLFGHWLSVFKFAYCSQRSYEDFALHMLEKGQPDLTGVFLIASDPISHTFWHFYEPKEFEGIDPEKAKRLGKLIPNFYEHNDRFLAKLLAKVDSNTVVIVVSDHGFESSGIVPKPVSREEFEAVWEEGAKTGTVAVGQSGKHDLDGILLAYGAPVKNGVTTRARLQDIAPTILVLMGLPVPLDMEGRVLSEIIDEKFLVDHPIQSISSFEDYLDRDKLAAPNDVNEEEILDRLRSLGYVK